MRSSPSALTIALPVAAALIVVQDLGSSAQAQPSVTAARQVAIHVTETAGIRRFNYPVHARVPFAAGQLIDADGTRLLGDDGTEVPSQISAETRWQDGSVQWLSVHLNTSIGPGASQTYRVEYGAGVRAVVDRPRGLTLVEGGAGSDAGGRDVLQVGSLRFNRTGDPLVTSVAYRDEAIGAGQNGFAAQGRGGESYRFAEAPELEILKRGPLYVEFRYSGQLTSGTGDRVPIVVTVGMPNSKSWVKMEATVSDPAARVSGLSLDLPFALGDHPWVWDFGTERWTYGSLRGANDSVVLTSVVAAENASSTSWEVRLQRDGRDQLYEAGDSAVSGWGHLQGAGEVVAFAVEDFGVKPGTYRIALGGAGQTTFGFTPARPTSTHRLAVYNHYVSTPVQIGAATSPSSMLNPLRAVCEPARYTEAGLERPTP